MMLSTSTEENIMVIVVFIALIAMVIYHRRKVTMMQRDIKFLEWDSNFQRQLKWAARAKYRQLIQGE